MSILSQRHKSFGYHQQTLCQTACKTNDAFPNFIVPGTSVSVMDKVLQVSF